MRTALIGLAALVLAGIGGAGAAHAEEWVSLGDSKSGRFDIDIAGLVAFEGGIVQGWVRNTLKRPGREPQGRFYSTSLQHQSFDCKGNRTSYGEVLYRDQRGVLVRSAPEPDQPKWEPLAPGTVAEGLQKTACGVAFGEEGEDIRKGEWRAAGSSSLTAKDSGFKYYLLWEDIAEVDADHIMVLSRMDFDTYQFTNTIPYRYLLMDNVLDCRRRQLGQISAAAYVTPTVRVMSEETQAKDLKLESIVPGSFMAAAFDKLCAQPRVALSEGKSGANEGTGGVSLGTAWATNKGYLVTASHVVAGGKSIAVYQNEAKVGEAKVVANDPANDLAVLKFTPTTATKLKIIPLAERAGALGRSVFTLGFPAPDVMGQKIKMSAGEISSTAGIQDDARYMQISIPIQQGNSGGPVLGYDGTALGVVATKLMKFSDDKDAPRPENVNYAVKVAYIRPLLEDLPDLQNYTALKVAAGAVADDLISQAREAVYMLVVKQ